TLSQALELLSQLRVPVVPRVPGQAAFAGRRLAARRVVAECGAHDRARVRQEALWMAGNVWLSHGEAHFREEAARAPLANVPFGFRIRLCARRTDDVEPQVGAESLELPRIHCRIV